VRKSIAKSAVMIHRVLDDSAPQTVPHRGTRFPRVASAAPMTAVPNWLRRKVHDAQSGGGQGAVSLEDVAITAGAAIGALDALVRRRERWAGVWRQRLALSAAAVTARQAGRVEGEAALRDAVLLTKSGDDAGPAGRLLLAWRRLVARPVEELLTEKNLAAVMHDFGYAHNDAAVSDLADELQQLCTSAGTVALLTGAFAIAERHGCGRAFGCWLADGLLARRLGWDHAVPLLGTEATPRGGRSRRAAAGAAASDLETEPERVQNLLAAQARAAVRGIDLFAELGRRADRLLTVAPKLRAKGSDAVVEKLLSDDAVVASQDVPGISDRGMRRLVDRLVEFGAVRELSGRPTFRIYGL
jgi:hypothetical protein